jgi:Tol biopolymer transport system component
VISDGGGNLHRISVAGDQVEGSSADWSPDGELIAYLGRDSTLRVIPATGGSSRVLASNLGPVRGEGVTWSPDGQEIAFTAGGRIWKVSRSGGEPSEIRIPLQGTPGQID